MRLVGKIVPLLLALVLVAVAINVAYASATVTVLVKSSTGTPVSGAVVYAYQEGQQVAKCSTNSSGVCTLTLPANTTTVFFVSYGGAKYALETLQKYVPAKVTIDASKMHYADLLTNVKYNIPVKIMPTLANATISVEMNATIYASEVIKLLYPKTYTVAPFRVAELEKITYDNVTTTNTTITLDLSSKNYKVTAYYKLLWKVTPNMYLFVAIGILFIILLIALAIAKSRRVKARTVGTY